MNRDEPALDLLLFSTLFPSAAQPRHGIFVEERLRQLARSCPVSARVVAPVPWFPLRGERFGLYGVHASVPRQETRDGREVWHPRYPVVPRLSWRVSPWLLYRSVRGLVRRLHAERPFELVDAHFFYPDGVAAVMLARDLGLPVCITARGSDLNLMPQFALPARFIRWAAAHADGLITVAGALRDRLAELGVDPARVTVLRNGVDTTRFAPLPRDEARRALGLDGPLLLSVGNLVELKGHDLVIEALGRLPGYRLAIVGDGPERARLVRLAERTGVTDRVHFAGLVAQDELPRWYSAADALVLASSREGWANVLLESMACGTPVVATPVGGTPEVVAAPAAGVLVPARSPDGIAGAVETLFAAPPAREDTRRYAEQFDWEATSRGQYALFRDLVTRNRARPQSATVTGARK